MVETRFCPKLAGKVRAIGGLDMPSVLIALWVWVTTWFFFGNIVGICFLAVTWGALWWLNRKERGIISLSFKRLSIPDVLPAIGAGLLKQPKTESPEDAGEDKE